MAVLGRLSGPQGATLLNAADPAALMAAHEKSLESPSHGLVPDSPLAPGARDAVAANTRLFGELKLRSVPFAVYQDASGRTQSFGGALSTDELRRRLAL